MIDYEKLKIAHEMGKKLPTGISVTLSINSGDIHKSYELSMIIQTEETIEHINTIDELIAKLRELTKPEPKYKVGDTWWFLDGPDFITYPLPQSLLITEENKNWFRADEEWWPSRESLIQAQIDHWIELKQEHCEHNYSVMRIERTDTQSKSIPVCSKCGMDMPKEGFTPNTNQVLTNTELVYCEHESLENSEPSSTNSECQHESDGTMRLSYSGCSKCIKCGEIYR